jgi:hypothetical protein
MVRARLDTISELKDGWFDGRGIAPDPRKIAVLSEVLVGKFPETIPLPAIAPTPEGNIVREWDSRGLPSVDIELASMTGSFHSLLPDGSEFEQRFELNSPEDWARLFAFLAKRIEGEAA